MSATNCEDPDHERCEKCSGCIPCGCLCHLAGEGALSGPEYQDSLIRIGLGLRPFQHETLCPKCSSTGIRVVYHPRVVLAVGSAGTPCAAWYQAGILTLEDAQHLCLRCSRCGYGWPTKTADAAPVEGLEDPG